MVGDKTKSSIYRLFIEVENSRLRALDLPLRKLLWHTMTEDVDVDAKKLILTRLDALVVEKGFSIWLRKYSDSTALKAVINIVLDAAIDNFSESEA